MEEGGSTCANRKEQPLADESRQTDTWPPTETWTGSLPESPPCACQLYFGGSGCTLQMTCATVQCSGMGIHGSPPIVTTLPGPVPEENPEPLITIRVPPANEPPVGLTRLTSTLACNPGTHASRKIKERAGLLQCIPSHPQANPSDELRPRALSVPPQFVERHRTQGPSE